MVREVVFCRHPDTPDVTDVRVTRHGYDARGHLVHSVDPGLYDRQTSGGGMVHYFRYVRSLDGTVLHSDSVDAGTTVTLNDAAGRPAIACDANGIIRVLAL